jgi:transforming growth factor-beta-induced protein
MKLITTAAVLAAATAPLAAQCKSEDTAQANNHRVMTATPAMYSEAKSILETASAAGNFTTLAAALNAAELIGALEGEGPFTVFAPTDEAFAALPKGTIDALLKPEARGMLTNILTYHVVPGRVEASEVVKADFVSGLNGQRLGITVGKDGVTIAGAKIVATDIECSNGVIHVIDAVMLPNTKDIIDTAVENGSFQTLAAAVGTAGLVEALKGEGPFTVFAPTDDAFAKLPAGTVESLLKEENRQMLTDILKYHVVSGRVYAGEAIKAEKAKTLQGGKLRFRFLDNALRVNGAQVINADIETSNGVIHVIDSVLLPE